MCEILAPAGDEKSFYAAIDAGADAVYLGLSDFSARKGASNFDLNNLQKYTRYAHLFGVRVYVAMNTLVKDSELEDFASALLQAYRNGADAIIVQDVFLGKLIKERYPDIVLHLSTQAGVCNVYGARLAKRFGFSRVILARETPLQDVKEIAAEIETEVFIQGALCTCFSGQCYLSAMAGGNSGNRGFCKQPCRKKYKVNRKGFENYCYAISLSDLCAGQDVFELMNLGVVSFKIEGRMRSPEYVRAAVTYYQDLLRGDRQKLDGYFKALKRSFNRGDYTRGYLRGQEPDLLSRKVQNHLGERIGTIRSISGKSMRIESNFHPARGDGFKVIREDGTEAGGFVFEDDKTADRNGFSARASFHFRVGDAVHLTNDTSLGRSFAHKTLPVNLCIEIAAGQKISVAARSGDKVFSMTSSFVVEPALRSAITEKDLTECFSKTDFYPFAVNVSSINLVGNVFVVKSQLNAFRRSFYEALFAEWGDPVRKDYPLNPLNIADPEGDLSEITAVIDTDFRAEIYKFNTVDYLIYKMKDYKNAREIDRFIVDTQYYVTRKLLYVPAYSVGKDLEHIRKIADRFDGLYGDGVFALELAAEWNMPLVAGTGFNVFNRADVAVLEKEGVKHVTLSKELSRSEADRLRCGRTLLPYGGSLKVMDLGHCLFSKTCADCDRKEIYTLTDEAGRKFILRRYENSACRFELYNCVPLVCGSFEGGKLYDFTALDEASKSAYFACGEDEFELKKRLGNYTYGALRGGVN